ncbi:hypothetical protein ASA1KI_42670 [Opitutales bacterium ASA1]|uniref:four helix bundle protein n=1 Tax=Congregicoccus parvus TaxID=3081749 RepID=UPI002B2DD275|nr:hypothetical protein ASA1KI_42670 [Opitutales bacterium ASA1]
MSKRVESFEDLNIYAAAFTLQQAIFELSKSWPNEERYSLTDQIRRASRSVGACLAESWAKRGYVAHFRSKLSDADGELNETRHWLKTARACGYLTEAQHRALRLECDGVGGQLGRMITEAETWCR